MSRRFSEPELAAVESRLSPEQSILAARLAGLGDVDMSRAPRVKIASQQARPVMERFACGWDAHTSIMARNLWAWLADRIQQYTPVFDLEWLHRDWAVLCAGVRFTLWDMPMAYLVSVLAAEARKVHARFLGLPFVEKSTQINTPFTVVKNYSLVEHGLSSFDLSPHAGIGETWERFQASARPIQVVEESVRLAPNASLGERAGLLGSGEAFNGLRLICPPRPVFDLPSQHGRQFAYNSMGRALEAWYGLSGVTHP